MIWGPFAGPAEIVVEPWPFSVEKVDLSVPVRRIAARACADSADLHRQLAQSAEELLHWTLTPSKESRAQ